MRGPDRQPRVRVNDWSALQPSTVGSWTPSRSVTVVIPAFRAEATLPYTLASLAAQSYPDHLLEVVVVDDGSNPPLELPERRPERTRLIATSGSWGRAAACRQGAEQADGDVIHWLDADMVLYHDEVEAQMRWHHLIDYAVVLGQKTFVDPDHGLPEVPCVYRAVSTGEAGTLFESQKTAPHEWVEAAYDRTGDLVGAGPSQAFRVHVGATASVGRALYTEAGGVDASLKLGEDIELGYRLSLCGCVFIPDRQARAWHLGHTTVMQRGNEVNRYNAVFFADRVSYLRYLRPKGRTFSVPYVQAVVDTRGHGLEQVAATVNGVLASTMTDVSCLLLGDWSALPDAPRNMLDDPDLDARLIEATYACDLRVQLVEEVAASAFPAAFRLTLPVGWAPGPATLGRLLGAMEERHHGLRQVLMPDGSVARLERTGAVLRTARLRLADEDPDDVIDEVFGSWWSEGEEMGFRDVRQASRSEHYEPPCDGSSSAGDDSVVDDDPRRDKNFRGFLDPRTIPRRGGSVVGQPSNWLSAWRGRRRR